MLVCELVGGWVGGAWTGGLFPQLYPLWCGDICMLVCEWVGGWGVDGRTVSPVISTLVQGYLYVGVGGGRGVQGDCFPSYPNSTLVRGYMYAGVCV